MGVRGLTTFMIKNSDKYLEWYRLHDTYLVIDGNNIACQLYKWHCNPRNRNDCFGGDYDKFVRVIHDFFKLLKSCNIIPIVIIDGGYENKKMKTVYQRLRGKLYVVKTVNSGRPTSSSLFPLFHKDLFVEIVQKLKITCLRADFEADYEMACLSKNLNCPLLSYDSDFYIFDVPYIPFNTFEIKSFESETDGYSYVLCKIYYVDNFIQAYPGLDKRSLPLIAALLGNDYINRRIFKKFYENVKMSKSKSCKSKQQKAVDTVIKWIRNETCTSAVNKVLSRQKKSTKRRVAYQIKRIINGYLCTNSKLLPYLNIDKDYSITDLKQDFKKYEIELEESEDMEAQNHIDELNNLISGEEDVNEDVISGEEDVNEDVISGEEVVNEDVEVTTNDNFNTVHEDSEDISGGVENEINEDVIDDNGSIASSELSDHSSKEEETTENIPQWFLDKYRRCHYPAMFMDIIVHNKYICIPQFENFKLENCHIISVKILAALNNILTSAKSDSLIYVTRNEQGNIQKYSTPPCLLHLPKLHKLKSLQSNEAIALISQILEINLEDIAFFTHVPRSWHLYILAIIYWFKNATPKPTNCHLYSILICVFILKYADVQVGYYRNEMAFLKKFNSKLINPVPNVKNTNVLQNHPFKDVLKKIDHKESVFYIKKLMKYFHAERYISNINLQILHPFAQFQSCLLYIQYLNMLLNTPFENVIVSSFFNGTFLYHMTLNLKKRPNIDAYVRTLFPNSPTITECLNYIISEIFGALGEVKNDGSKPKRKRRKKKPAKSVTCDLNKSIEDDSDDRNFIDLDNKFALLSTV